MKTSTKTKSSNGAKARVSSSKNSIEGRLIDLIDKKVSSVKIWNQPKRMTMPNGDRDWTVRVCWEVEKGEKRLESKWEGFETTEQAVKDLLKKCSG